MTICDVWIEGRSPMLMNKYQDPTSIVENDSPEEQARRSAHFDHAGCLRFSAVALWFLLREVGKSCGVLITPARVSVLGEWIPLVSFDLAPVIHFSVDARPVRVRATQVRELRYRARIDEWAATFRLRVNERLIQPSTIRRVLSEGGSMSGLGDFRPQRGGPFGKFAVIGWRETTDGAEQHTNWMEAV
jgi:hypothetical protein